MADRVEALVAEHAGYVRRGMVGRAGQVAEVLEAEGVKVETPGVAPVKAAPRKRKPKG